MKYFDENQIDKTKCFDILFSVTALFGELNIASVSYGVMYKHICTQIYSQMHTCSQHSEVLVLAFAQA